MYRYILDKRVKVEISKRGRGGGRGRDRDGEGSSGGGAKIHTDFRVKIVGLPDRVDWKSLKDHLKRDVDVVFADVTGGGEGVAEFRSLEDLEHVISRLDETSWDGSKIRIFKETSRGGGDGGGSRNPYEDRGRDRDFGRDRDRERDRGDRDRDAGRDRDRRDYGRDRERGKTAHEYS